MNATIFSLLAVTFGFVALLLWVYAPRRKAQLEAHGRIPLDDGTPAGADRRTPHDE